MKNIYLFITSIFIITLLPIRSIEMPYSITNERQALTIPTNKYVYYIEDKKGTITIDSLLHNANHYRFKLTNDKSLNFGFTNSTIWLKISINNQTKLNKDFFFSIDYPLLNEVTLYETLNAQIIRRIKTGESVPFNSREIKDKSFVFLFSNAPLQQKTYFVRIFNNGEPLRIPLHINSPIHEKEVQTIQIVGIAIYYGYLLFSILLNTLLFFNFKKRQYFYFGGFVCTFALFIFIGDGYAYQYFWPSFPWFANHSIIMTTAFTNFFMLAFSRDFLNYKGFLKYICNIFFAIFILFFLFAFTNYPIYQYSVRFANVITFITILYIFISSIICIRKRNSLYNLVFLMAFLFVMTGTTMYILRNFNLLSGSYIIQYAIKIGFILQIMVLTFALIIKFKMDITDVNITLEREVTEQTAEIRAQNDKLLEHNTKIELQSKEITDSIIYAKRIQSAILPEHQKFTTYFKDHFIMFKPKQIVSGDFYWFAEKNGKVYIAVADCTGHGVPGGFLSMLGISFLNEIINKDIVLPPNMILNELQRLITSTLSKKMDDGMTTRDGMDISLCAIDFVNNKFEFAGANNPLFLVRNKEIKEHTVDKIPIGHHVKTDKVFTHHEFDLLEGDQIYLCSDGYIDQFNMLSKKRFSKAKFKQLLLDIHQKPFKEQHLNLEKTLNKWQGNSEQIDDILIIGLLM